MTSLPVDERGFLVPFFVEWRDGKPLFDVADQRKYKRCVEEDLCWLCGKKLNLRRAFVLGPMCMVNRVTAEPPCHVPCAEYACRVCPFLTMPMAKRQPQPEGTVGPAGEMIKRNPGAVLLWLCRRKGYNYVRYPDGGVLVHLESEPLDLRAWSRGEDKAWDEVSESMRSGMPLLEEMCKTDQDHQALYMLSGEAEKLLRRAEKGTL